jgi:hypothetical protein
MLNTTTHQDYDPSKTYVGLFGTCGNSTWRQAFMELFEKYNIDYFNPQVDDWNDKFAVIEAKHLVKDDIVIFPVTKDTYGTGSLAETGFSIMQVLKSMETLSSKHRKVILMIDPSLDEKLKIDNPLLAKESIRARALVLAHLDEVRNPNVYAVTNIQDMLTLCVELYPGVRDLKHAYAAVNKAQSHLDSVRHKHESAQALGLEDNMMSEILKAVPLKVSTKVPAPLSVQPTFDTDLFNSPEPR